jgi:hypothetical protein
MKLKVRMNGKAKGRKLFVCLVATSFAIALAFAGAAGATVNWQFSFGTTGSKGGQFNQPAGIAINQATGDVYVADRGVNASGNERIQEFTSSGEFVRAWGVDVVESGEDNKPAADEVQTVRIKAASGTFALSFGAATSAFVPYNATAAELQTALNATSTISAGGGSVSVSGGPGDATGSTPYVVTFNGGPLAGKDVSQLVINESDLGIAVGTQLNCSQESVDNPSIAYRWIANGVTIPAANSSSYTVAAGDAGKVVQCVVLATWGEDTLLEAGVPFQVVSPAPTPPPPIPPPASSLFNIFGTGSRAVGTPGGSTLTCEANTWTQGPTEYTYRMFRNGVEVGSPVTTTATTNVYTFTTADLSSPADFQCGVTGKNAGGGESTFFSRDARTEPAPPGCCHVFNRQVVTVAANGVGTGVSSQNGGPAFEVCKANPPSTDVCKAGLRGDALGQFNRPRGVAVDQATGDVYVGDDRNFRVQKFTATGTPILTFGKKVNKSTGAGICTVASGDACGTGLQSLDETSGTFGGWPTGGVESPEGGSQENDFKELGNSVAVDGSGNVYVTDPYLCCGSHRTRIQKFDSSGNFLGQVFTNGVTSEAKPLSVAADAAGHVFTAVGGEQRSVVVSEPPDFTLEGTEQTFVERYVLHENEDPVQVAAEPIDPKVWIMDRNRDAFNGPSRHVCHEADNTSRRALLSYDLEGHRLDCTVPTGEGELGQVSGLASSSTRLFVSNKSLNKVKVFSLPPDIAPAVGKESVSRITTETAKIGAEINPGYEPTSYVVEYGLADCEVSGECASVPGASKVYGAMDVSVELPLKELKPNTRYHYRIVAENSIGTGPGVDRTFVTYPFVDLVNDPCPNALARKQTRTAGALDCRADELASASFTGGYDVTSDLVPGLTPFDGYPDAPGKFLYSVRDGGIPGTGSPTNRGPDPYLATRDDEGWTTKYVGIPADGGFSEAPFSSTLAGADSGLDTFAFAGPEICSPCFADGSTGIPVRFPDGTLAQGMHGQFDQGASAKSDGLVRKRLSADGTHFVFGSLLRYQPDGNNNTGDVSIYDRNLSTGVTQVVSKSPAGANLTCLQGAGTCHSPTNTAGIAELDISKDGSRIVVAQRISTDTAGNHYWHLYMHRGTSNNTVDLTPGTIAGALFDGMTEDGSEVFFTTKDSLLAGDEDTSADIYLAEVGSSGPATLKLLSAPEPAPEPGNVDSCNPPGEPNNWNTVSGAGQCDVVALAGGAGVAGGDGTFYFLSPELLDGPGNGIVNQPNLYVVRPGPTAPHFVATLDDSNTKPPPPPKPPPEHPVVGNVISGLSTPESVAVDQSNGDIYVAERGNGSVDRYTSAGAPHNFPFLGATNKLTGQSLGGTAEGQIAVDNAPGSPFQGDFYVTTNGGSVRLYSNTGEKLGELTGFGEACGVAVDESNGAVYVGDYSSPGMWRFLPTSGTTPVTNANYSAKTGLHTSGMEPCQVGADSSGQAYATNWSNGPTQAFPASHFAVAPPTETGTELALSQSNVVNTDPATSDVYADTGGKIVEFNSSHNQVTEFGSGSLSNSRGVAVNGTTKHVYASTGSTVVEFGFVVPPYEPPPLIDDPAVVHALQGNETRRYSDFQTTPDGHYGLFSTKLLLNPEYDNAGHRMVYRYDAVGDSIACASCLPTEGTPRGDASLPSHGLGISDAGGVFFNSTDPLVMRDTNEKLDAYEWENGALSLISTGFSAFPSSLLTVTADGKDAFFFTRETLVPSDNNGQAMKIYDAREGGGFFVIPTSPPCAASDECHGPGTQAAPPPSIGTVNGTGGQHNQVHCKRGFVLKHGRCVRKRKHHRRHHRHSQRRRAATGQGSSR